MNDCGPVRDVLAHPALAPWLALTALFVGLALVLGIVPTRPRFGTVFASHRQPSFGFITVAFWPVRALVVGVFILGSLLVLTRAGRRIAIFPVVFAAAGSTYLGAVGAAALPGYVPDDYVVVKGGEAPPPLFRVTSGAAGATLYEAAQAVPHGKIRQTTALTIRSSGGWLVFATELTREGTPNEKHVNICLTHSVLGPLEMNPVPKKDRIR